MIPSEFRIEFLKMEKQDSIKAKKTLQDFQQLSFFSLVENLEEFSNLMSQISDLCLFLLIIYTFVPIREMLFQHFTKKLFFS